MKQHNVRVCVCVLVCVHSVCVHVAFMLMKPALLPSKSCVVDMGIFHSLNYYSTNRTTAKNTTHIIMMCLFKKPQRRLPLLLCQAQRGNYPHQHVANQRETHILHCVPLPSPQLQAASHVVLNVNPVSSSSGNVLD